MKEILHSQFPVLEPKAFEIDLSWYIFSVYLGEIPCLLAQNLSVKKVKILICNVVECETEVFGMRNCCFDDFKRDKLNRSFLGALTITFSYQMHGEK